MAQHRLLRKYPPDLEGECLECGPVEIQHKGKGRYRCANAVRAQRRRRSPTSKRADRLRQLYGLTQEDWDQLVLLQGGRCRICEDPADLVVDHDHQTGRVRGLLCPSCNLGLGFFRDNPLALLRATAYLEAQKSPLAALRGQGALLRWAFAVTGQGGRAA